MIWLVVFMLAAFSESGFRSKWLTVREVFVPFGVGTSRTSWTSWASWTVCGLGPGRRNFGVRVHLHSG